MRVVRIDKHNQSVSLLQRADVEGQLHSQFDVDTVDGLMKKLAKGHTVETLTGTYQNEVSYCAGQRRAEAEQGSLWSKVRRLLSTAFEK